MRWLLVFKEYAADSDYMEAIPYIAAVVKADTRRKAQSEARRLFPNMRFSGMFAPRLVEFPSEQSMLYTQQADGRLNRHAIHLHRAALEQLK